MNVNEIPDYLSRSGAERLARRIEGYWLGRGVRVKTEVVPSGIRNPESHSHHGCWCVRSNLKLTAPTAV